MKKTIFALSTALLLTAGMGVAPSSAWADETLYAAFDYEPMGSVETAAVTGPISVGGITYIPCGTCDSSASGNGTGGNGTGGGGTGGGGTGYPPLGSVETVAVTSPIEVGGIIYIPGVS